MSRDNPRHLPGALAELGRLTGVSGPVVHCEVGRLVQGEVLADRYEGRNRLVRANQNHPLFPLMRDLVASTYGPIPVLASAFAGVKGVQQVLIHGSWAARRSGEPGPFPRDLDVLVIGDAPRRALAEIAARVGGQLDLSVNITRLADHSPRLGP